MAPHAPAQGSLHLLFIQAKWLGHSLLLEHSGRQFGGDPTYSAIQEHDGASLIAWQIEYGPQGEGKQGFICGGISSAAKYLRNVKDWQK